MAARATDERTGLLLIAAALCVIAVISGLVLTAERDARAALNREKGLDLVRLLSNLGSKELLLRPGPSGPIGLVSNSQSNPDFAYAAVVGPAGEPLAEFAAPGVVVPRAPTAAEGASWTDAREIESPGGRTIHDFHAPVPLDDGRIAQVRVGYFAPDLALLRQRASYFGMLALPIFLLAPLAYFLIRRELRPLADACGQLEQSMARNELAPMRIDAGGQVGDLVRTFNRFVELAEGRARDLRERETGALASSKVVSYQKSRVESVLETLPHATLVLDDSGVVSFANAKIESQLGISPTRVVGRRVDKWCNDPEMIEFLANYEGPHPRLCRSEAIEFSPANAPEKRLALSAHPIAPQTAGSAASGTVALLRDVTATSLAQRAQGEFVTHVAHELKSPLNVISMYSEALLGEEGKTETFRIEACNVLKDEVERVSLLVSTLLGIARIETGSVVLDRQRVKLEDFLRDAMQAAGRSARAAGLSFRLGVAAELGAINVDKELLRVAVNNLLTNAIKYNREGGEVTVVAESSEESIAIRVRDTGLGIAEAECPRVFEKFYRSEDATAQARGGHGLGLALTRQIVALHGGEMKLESTLGEGSVFSMVFPKTATLIGEKALT